MQTKSVKTDKTTVKTGENIKIQFQIEYKNDFPFDFRFDFPIARIKK